QSLVRFVPYGQCKHAAEPLNEVDTPLLVGVREDFSVSMRVEGVSAQHEFGAEILEIVDFAILNCANRPILIRHGLTAALKIDDREPPCVDHGGPVMGRRAVVWAAMAKKSEHSIHRRRSRVRVGTDYACDTAHG